MGPHLLHTPAEAAAWLHARLQAAGTPGTLRSDSRTVQPGDAFLAWPGAAGDGRRFVAAALAAGAAACLVDADGLEGFGLDASDPRIAALPGLKAGAGEVASLHFGQPSRALQVLAVTGTNGKTSTACGLAQALQALGRRCAVVGTLGLGEWPASGDITALQDTGLTTPDAVTLQAALRGFVDAGITHVALEASSIGLVQHRLAGTHIAVAMFTNLTQDHLDVHGSMQAYGAAKRLLFDWPGLPAAVVNVDDAFGAALAQDLAARSDLALWPLSLQGAARLQGRGLRHGAGATGHGAGLAFEVVETVETVETAGEAAGGQDSAPVASPLIGSYNAANLLGIVAALRALGVPLTDACAAAGQVRAVAGRMEQVTLPDAPTEAPLPAVVVDYAHTPDALQQALAALRPLAAARGGRLWCVFGCGGNRDASKRPLMGAIAAAAADAVVITSDNPRGEPPAAILAQVRAGVPATAGAAVRVIEDRRAAIAHAIATAAPADVLLLAGKGHEPYQEVAGVRRPFSDLAEARHALARRATPTPPAGASA